MAQLAAYSTLYPYAYPRLPGCDDAVLLQALQSAGRTFCKRTKAYHDDLEPIPVVNYQEDYVLTPPTSCEILQVDEVRLNDSRLLLTDYEIEWRKATLILRIPTAPYDQDETLLVCDTAGEDDYTAWAAITDGSVGVEIGGTSEDITDIDFTGVTSMDQVALKIQTAIRTEAEINNVWVRWYTDHFVLWTKGSDIDYLTAGSAGTDISGASYMNGLTGVATLAAKLDVHVVLAPQLASDVLPDWFLDRWGEAIADGAVMGLAASSPAMPYFSRDVAMDARVAWFDAIGSALRERDTNYRTQKTTVEA